jgi:acylglycerol lipase
MSMQISIRHRACFLLCLMMSGMLQLGCQASSITATRPVGEAAWSEAKQSWISRDGETFAYTVWPAQGEKAAPRAVIVAVHGLSGAASDFEPLGIDAAKQGVVTYAYELRGQGNDPVRKRRGDIQHPRLWLADLADFTRLVRQRHPDAPLFYYGESMGALIVLHAASTTQANFDGVIFASPVVRVKHPLSWWQTLLLRVMGQVAPDYRISLNENEAASPRLTRDNAYQQRLQQAPHTITRFSLRLLGHLTHRSPKFGGKSQIARSFGHERDTPHHYGARR